MQWSILFSFLTVDCILNCFLDVDVAIADSFLFGFNNSDVTLKPFVQFAEGLFEDHAAVKASMMTTVSNGPFEGLNNRLKMLKRQMYGRAGLDLLTKRFILNL
jgi:Transposase